MLIPALSTFTIVMIVVIVVLIVVLVVLYLWGSKLQKQQAEQEELMENAKQTVSLLVIDKKKLKASEAGLPKQVTEQTPWYLKRAKLPVVKVKVGPKIMTMIADPNVYEVLPIKQEVKAVISGIYIKEVKGIRGNLMQKPKKKKLSQRLMFWKKDNTEK